MRYVQTDIVKRAVEESHPLRVQLGDLFAFDLGDVILIGIIRQTVTEPIIVSFQRV